MWIALWHALGIIDATVFAQLSDFDVSEDLAFRVAPAIIPQATYAQGGMPAIGLNLKISF
jgi:hypothetical protein